MSFLLSDGHLDQRRLDGPDSDTIIDALRKFTIFLQSADVEERKPTPELYGATPGQLKYNIWRIYQTVNIIFSPSSANIIPISIETAFIANKPLRTQEYTHLTKKNY
ncbi:hypothetical protein MGYG_06218 [Nannizzia gypsea CBS 118893]|uniref:Uncharacterized protein n=1 Tax=Arthroderma gypseum (strain ATCC MYA-4604 / CBS 118893) TaxID=535722 RepID=E4UYN8_ARTGP|nr:hypothetical protein MGYG_06218 [Nannizzia gypsea CBS 118893]EFR03218.1 hypothetical protein MGYG_06218 [Nannizzia gypsea CBS 118893]